MQALIDQLQGKIKSFKKQIEEIAALNLAKFRHAQNNVSGAQERADVNEQALAKAKARSLASSLAPVSQLFTYNVHFITFLLSRCKEKKPNWRFSHFQPYKEIMNKIPIKIPFSIFH
jgi:hypothetical protein